MMRQITLGIVIAALLVSAPRLTLAFLIGDGIQIAPQVEIGILAVTGIASGIVLTIGNAILAHTLARKANQRTFLWWFEAMTWLLFLLGAVVLIAPTLRVGLQETDLAAVLATPQAEWIWATTAVLIVELLVAAAMAATILADETAPQGQHTHPQPNLVTLLGIAVAERIRTPAPRPDNGQPGVLTLLGTALAERIRPSSPTTALAAAAFATQPMPLLPTTPSLMPTNNGQQATAPVITTGQVTTTAEVPQAAESPEAAPPVATATDLALAKARRQQQLLRLLQPITKPEEINTTVLAQQLQVTPQTIRRDLKELQENQRLSVTADQVRCAEVPPAVG